MFISLTKYAMRNTILRTIDFFELVHKMSIVFGFIVFDFQQQGMILDNDGSTEDFSQAVYNLYCLPFVRAYNVLQ